MFDVHPVHLDVQSMDLSRVDASSDRAECCDFAAGDGDRLLQAVSHLRAIEDRLKQLLCEIKGLGRSAVG